MTKEECMEALEQIILELSQYREVTNELCDRHISDYVRNEYEQKEIYTDGNHSSSTSYCWDVYNNIPIEVLESILDYFKETDDAKGQLQQKDKAIDECIKFIESKYFEEKGCDYNFNEAYCDYGVCLVDGDYDTLLEKLQQAKGGCDENTSD